MGKTEFLPLPLQYKAKISKQIDQVLIFFFSTRIAELIVLGLAAFFYFYNAFHYAYPVGYAGLYSIMVETISKDAGKLPITIPYYGPGGIPFGYPPLAFYITAIVIKVVHISIFDWCRFAPPVFALGSSVAAYFFINEILGNRVKTLVALALLIPSVIIYNYQVTAAGMVRGLAFLFAINGLIFSWKAFSLKSHLLRNLLLSGLFFGLTFLTHPTYAVFFIASILWFGLYHWRSGWASIAEKCLVIFLIGLLVAVPWWTTVLFRFGWSIFITPMLTHGNLNTLYRINTQPIFFIGFTIKRFLAMGENMAYPILWGLSMLAFGYEIVRRKYFLLVWFLILFFCVGESERFMIFIACMAAAELIIDTVDLFPKWTTGEGKPTVLLQFICVALVLGPAYRDGLVGMMAYQPIDFQQAIDLGHWLARHSGAGAQYLLISEDTKLSEWFPYLIHRTPVAAVWGSEWNGNMPSQSQLVAEVANCAISESLFCVQNMIEDNGISPNYLIVPTNKEWIIRSLETDSRLEKVYASTGFIVYQK